MARHKRSETFEEDIRADRLQGVSLDALVKKYQIGFYHLKQILSGEDYSCRRNTYKVTPYGYTILTIKSRNRANVAVLIDTEDVERVRAFPSQWRVQVHPTSGYVCIVGSTFTDRERVTVLSRYILNAPEEFEVDHFNNNTLDNRKANLRLATKSENGQNRKTATRRSKTGVRNVSYDARRNTYTVRVKIPGGSYKHVGSYPSIDLAEKAAIHARTMYQPFSKEGTHHAKVCSNS